MTEEANQTSTRIFRDVKQGPIAPLMSTPYNDFIRDENDLLPRDVLTTLISSVNNLQTSVGSLRTSVSSLQQALSKLEHENKALRDELYSTKTDFMILQENCGVRFPQFMKLPVELRR